MSRQKQQKQFGGVPLPEYASIIRWTVNDVIEWLKKNKLKESVSCCRLAGVDGNKLMNCTETDLQGISCPEKEIKTIMVMIKQVDTPGRHFGNSRYNNKQDGYKRPAAPPRNDSEDDSDDSPWGSDFDDSDGEDYLEPEPQQPAPPPVRGRCPPIPNSSTPPANTPGRRKPPPPPQEDSIDQDDYMDPEPDPAPPVRRLPPRPLQHEPSEEFYEDPDKTVKVQNIHGGPLPRLPGIIRANEIKAPPIGRQIRPPRGRAPSSDSSGPEDAEEYEDPDQPPPVPAIVPTRSKKHKNPPAAPQNDPQEVYEDPDAPSPAIPPGKQKGSKGKAPAPAPTKQQKEEEVYEDPEPESPESPIPPPVPRSIPKRPTIQLPPTPPLEDYEKPQGKPEPPPNIPKRPGAKPVAKPQANEQEVYEEPDAPAVPTPPRNVPKRGNTKQSPKPPVEQDVYEVPDVDEEPPVPAPPQSKKFGAQKKTKAKSPVPPPQEEEYEEPDAIPINPPRSKSVPKPKVNYTQVDIKLDHRNTTSIPSIPTATISPSVTENLEQQKWYYGDTHRDIIKQRLEQHKTNGMYVIRKSTKSPSEPFTLQIFYDSRVFNLSIRKRDDNKYAIGVFKPDEKGFSTLLEMINFFKQNFLVLSGGSQTKLLRSLPKES